jgi:pimeloyl-ACP methyl ester carboxylesterase
MPEKTLNGKKINYVKEGTGEMCFILIHGWGGSLESLRPLHNMLKTDYTSVILDLPGFGHSDNPEPSWGVDEYAAMALDFIKSFECKKLVLLGHSFGGTLALYLSAKNPELVDKLILCSPSFKREPKKEEEINSGAIKNTVKKITGLPIYKKIKPHIGLVRKVFYKIFYPGFETARFPHLETNFKKIVTQDISHLIPKVQQKTLIMWGDRDTWVPLEYAEILQKGIKNSNLKIFEGITHGLPKLHPDLVYEEVKKFMEVE